jgi:hypothetical protein
MISPGICLPRANDATQPASAGRRAASDIPNDSLLDEAHRTLVAKGGQPTQLMVGEPVLIVAHNAQDLTLAELTLATGGYRLAGPPAPRNDALRLLTS